MGAACSGGGKVDENTKRIEKDLRDEKKRLNELIKVLLLGAGESGKSTIAKQFKIINKGDYTQDELKAFTSYLHENCLASIKSLVNAADTFSIQVSKDNLESAQRIRDMELNQNKTITIDDGLAKDIKALWTDAGIQDTYKRANEYQLNDNAKYCLENIERLSAPGFIPTQQDVIHCRVRTTGVLETNFELGKRQICLVDVGGQRAERRKWMGCFQDVTAVIFCLALSEYDLKLAEDGKTNRMHESIRIFEELTGRWFPKTAIVLFLNKADLFKEKIGKVSLKQACFPEYDGPNEFEPACEFIKQKFVSLDKAENERLYPHITCATDTNNVRKVWDAIKNTLVSANLEGTGIV